jgi:hypothetical protein
MADDTASELDGLARVEISEEELLHEARALRQHKQKLEERSRVLEDHNKQLEVQLLRLKQLIDEHNLTGEVVNGERGSPSLGPPGSLVGGGTLPSGAGSVGGTPLMTPVQSAHSTLQRQFQLHPTLPLQSNEDTDTSGPDQTESRIESLMSTAQDLGRAMETLVSAVTSDDEEEEEEEL